MEYKETYRGDYLFDTWFHSNSGEFNSPCWETGEIKKTVTNTDEFNENIATLLQDLEEVFNGFFLPQKICDINFKNPFLRAHEKVTPFNAPDLPRKSTNINSWQDIHLAYDNRLKEYKKAYPKLEVAVNMIKIDFGVPISDGKGNMYTLIENKKNEY